MKYDDVRHEQYPNTVLNDFTSELDIRQNKVISEKPKHDLHSQQKISITLTLEMTHQQKMEYVRKHHRPGLYIKRERIVYVVRCHSVDNLYKIGMINNN